MFHTEVVGYQVTHYRIILIYLWTILGISYQDDLECFKWESLSFIAYFCVSPHNG